MIATGLVVLSLLTGLVGTAMAQGKKQTVEELAGQPLAASAMQVYVALSDADATAVSAFLATGAEPQELRQRFEDSIAGAGASLSAAATDAVSVSSSAERVETISTQLPVYAGLIETARTSNREELPAGAIHLRQASELMRSTLLPAAQDLYRIDSDRLVAEQQEARSFPTLTVVLTIALLGALLGTQVYLRRTTNRVLNRGLVVATAAVVIGVVWMSVALVVQSVHVSAGQRDGSEQVDLLVDARISAFQARTGETLALVDHGNGQDHREQFTRLAEDLTGADGAGGLLAEARELVDGSPAAEHVDAAMEHAGSWLRAHSRIREVEDNGDHADAVELTIDAAQGGGSAAAFAELDESLRAAIAEGEDSFGESASRASSALTMLPQGLAAFGIIAALGSTVGIWERLREYR